MTYALQIHYIYIIYTFYIHYKLITYTLHTLYIYIHSKTVTKIVNETIYEIL